MPNRRLLKGVVEISMAYRQDAVQLLQLAAHIFAQQIVQFAHGHHHPGMAQHCGACWTIVQIDLPGLRWVDRQRDSLSRGSGSLSRAYSRSAATGCQRSPCGGRGLASSRGLLAILARRHAMVALKQIAHHSRAGEPLFAGDLLDGFAGG